MRADLTGLWENEHRVSSLPKTRLKSVTGKGDRSVALAPLRNGMQESGTDRLQCNDDSALYFLLELSGRQAAKSSSRLLPFTLLQP